MRRVFYSDEPIKHIQVKAVVYACIWNLSCLKRNMSQVVKYSQTLYFYSYETSRLHSVLVISHLPTNITCDTFFCGSMYCTGSYFCRSRASFDQWASSLIELESRLLSKTYLSKRTAADAVTSQQSCVRSIFWNCKPSFNKLQTIILKISKFFSSFRIFFWQYHKIRIHDVFVCEHEISILATYLRVR